MFFNPLWLLLLLLLWYLGGSMDERGGTAERESTGSRLLSPFRKLWGKKDTAAEDNVEQVNDMLETARADRLRASQAASERAGPRTGPQSYRDTTSAILAKYGRSTPSRADATSSTRPPSTVSGLSAASQASGNKPASEGEYGFEGVWTQKRLIKLHERVIRAEYTMRREKMLFEEVCSKVFDLEDAIKAASDVSHVWHSSVRPARTGRFARELSVAEWWWRVWFKPITFRLFSVALALLSLTVIWCLVVTIFVSPDLSLFSLLMHSRLPAWSIQILMVVPPLYMLATAASSLFQIRVWTFFELFQNQQSPPSSLLFSAAYISRVAAPCAFTVLSMSRLVFAHVTAFSDIIGDYTVVPILDVYFPLFAPLVLCLLCVLTIFSVGSRIMNGLSRLLRCVMCCAKCKTFVFEEGFNDKKVEVGERLLRDGTWCLDLGGNCALGLGGKSGGSHRCGGAGCSTEGARTAAPERDWRHGHGGAHARFVARRRRGRG